MYISGAREEKKEGEKNFFEGINFLHALLSYYCTTLPPPRRAADTTPCRTPPYRRRSSF